MSKLVSRLVCAGCGYQAPPDDPTPFRCPNRGRGGVDHVLRRRLSCGRSPPSGWREIFAGSEPNPFLRYRELLHSYLSFVELGGTDAGFTTVVASLDQAVAAVDGHGFVETPLVDAPDLARALGVRDVVYKDETGSVAGSHKGRHLFGLMLWLGLQGARLAADRRLAIASCGNAALAAAVIARAAGRELEVFVPPDADAAILDRLGALGCRLAPCARRQGEAGDPCYLRFGEALEAGALPFTCQGNENALTLDGGRTLAWEMVSKLAEQGRVLDRLFVQVGGGALASACFEALAEARKLGALERLPRVHAVQTTGAHPLERAYGRVVERLLGESADASIPGGDAIAARAHRAARSPSAIAAALAHAAAHRSDYMWPWEEEPRSIADGILDDETYDWLAVVEAMLVTAGYPVTVTEEDLTQANSLARRSTGVAASHTGTAGLAGALQLARRGELGERETVGVLFTGVDRHRTAAS